MNRGVLDLTRSQQALFFLGCAAFTAMGVWMISHGGIMGWLIGGASVLFFGGGAIAVAVTLLLQPRATAPAHPERGFPYPLRTVPGAAALAVWEGLRAGPGTPVVIGDDRALARVAGAVARRRGKPEAILKAAASLRFPEDYLAQLREREAKHGRDPEIDAIPDGRWPAEDGAVVDEPWAGREAPGGRFAPKVHIALLPTDDPTAVPAFLGFGDVNGMPAAAMQVAFLRWLRDAYGGVLFACNGEALEVRVDHGPATRADALALARLLYDYTGGEVPDGFAEDAADRMRRRWWWFWWD